MTPRHSSLSFTDLKVDDPMQPLRPLLLPSSNLPSLPTASPPVRAFLPREVAAVCCNQ